VGESAIFFSVPVLHGGADDADRRFLE